MNEDSVEIDPEELQSAGEDEQRRVMREWFLERYEDPQNSLSYDNEGEAGYAWPSGGPYDAHVELSDAFHECVPEEVITSVANELESDCIYWHKISDLDYVDEYFAEAIEADDHPLETLRATLSNTERLIKEEPDPYLLSLALVGVIAGLEAFFLDFFSRKVLGDEALLRRYVESEPKFKERRLALSTIFMRREALTSEVRKHLANLLWHRIGTVKEMYEATFSICMPKGALDVIGPAIMKRHDIVHRGGRAKDGAVVVVKTEELTQLITVVRGLGTTLIDQIEPSPF